MATFILVPGATFPAWVWHPVIPLLSREGHQVIAPDLPGTGENRSIDPADATLAIWADFIAREVRRAQAPVVLVGHSRGGHVIGATAELVPDLIACLVYVVGILSTPGQTMFDTVSVGGEIVTAPATPMIRMPNEYMLTHMLNRCSPEIAAEAMDRLFAESLTPAKTPSGVTLDRWGKVPRAYIECSDDKSLSLECQRVMQAKAPCDPVIMIDADHCPFLSAPQDLAEALLSIGQRFVLEAA